MAQVKSDENGGLVLPYDFLNRRHMPMAGEYWLDEREGDLILHPRVPNVRKLYIEATTGCNLDCRTCIRSVWSDPSENMSMETFERILESLPGLPNLERVIFTSFGEPLTHPHILDMIAAVRARGLTVTLGSNGLLLRPEISAELVKLGVDRLMISLDGSSPQTYQDIRGAMLEQVLENIRKFNEAKKRLKSLRPALGVEFVLLRSNQHELPGLISLAGELNVARILVSNVLPYTEDMRAEVMYGYGPRDPLPYSGFPVRADAWVMWGTMEMPRMHWSAQRRCRFVNDRAMVVGWDGGISPCYALSHSYSYYAIDGVQKQVTRYDLGNVNRASLAHWWMEEEYMRFRSEVLMYHFPSCPDCDLRATCDVRQLNEGCWGWNPSCADCLWAQDIVRCP